MRIICRSPVKTSNSAIYLPVRCYKLESESLPSNTNTLARVKLRHMNIRLKNRIYLNNCCHVRNALMNTTGPTEHLARVRSSRVLLGVRTGEKTE